MVSIRSHSHSETRIRRHQQFKIKLAKYITFTSNFDINYLGSSLEPGMNRQLISYQPARIILLDVVCPLEVQAGKLICDALENTLCISSNMAGPSRIPLMSIYILASNPENVLPLTCTKGNFVRLHSALSDIRKFLDESLHQTKTRETESSIIQGILKACEQYKRYTGNLSQAAGVFKQLELYVLTGHKGETVHKLTEKLAGQIDFSMIKRIVYVSLNCSLEVSEIQDSPDVPMFDVVSDEFSGLVDFVTLECDSTSLQKFFYIWLVDAPSESEQMHLFLPPPNPTEPDLVIKCDFAERIICPTQLPYSDAFNLHIESNVCKHVFPTSSKAIGITVPISQLKVIRCLSREVLCESVLFGLPLILLPTSGWKIDWEVLEKNQQNFASFCNELLSKDQVLLAQLVVPSSKPPEKNTAQGMLARRLSSAAVSPKPAGLFVLMPSGNRSLLVKSVISRELLLPSPQSLGSGVPTEESDQRVQASLSQVERVDDFNPLDYESGLLTALRHSSLPKSAVDKARTLKRLNGLAQTKTDWVASSVPPPQKLTDRGGSFAVYAWFNPIAENFTLKQSLFGNKKN